MKILWVSPFFLHPTDRGGQIRTLGTMKELHKRHEIHIAALNPPTNAEGPRRSTEYSTRHIAVAHAAPRRGSAAMVPQLIGSLFSPVPLAVSRYASGDLRRTVSDLVATEHYDSIVCDFLTSVPNIPELGDAVLFQHNVETTIWQRHVERTTSTAQRLFFAIQARRMKLYERQACRRARSVIAVSEVDAQRMREMFGISHVEAVSTGVDLEYFARPEAPAIVAADLLFSGSMDWLPNVDAIEYFLAEVLPLVRARRPGTTLTIAGRSPDPRVHRAAEGVAGVTVTGSIPDMRPYLWGSKVSIVPIRIGGGTRLKIYECMAAGLPVVSTTVGAEGLDYTAGRDILLADTPERFAAQCLRLLDEEDTRRQVSAAALALVASRFSWAAVTTQFEDILSRNRITAR